MPGTVIPYDSKRKKPVVDWDWMGVDASAEAVAIPVMGTVAAGVPIKAISAPDSITVPKDLVGRRTYALRVQGDSMVDENIQHGDFIVIEARETAENGETVVAMINDEEVTLKRLFIERDHIRLQPANPAMKPIVLRNEAVRVLGVVCAVIRKYNRRP